MGESDNGAWALNLMENKFEREEPFINQYFASICGGVLGFIVVLGGKFGTRRPLFSGIHMHAVGTAVGAGIFEWFNRRANRYYAHRDAVLRHYITLHPEDFPPPERKKVSELLLEWGPIR